MGTQKEEVIKQGRAADGGQESFFRRFEKLPSKLHEKFVEILAREVAKRRLA